MTNARLTSAQKDQLLSFFAFNLTMELRERLMAELPMAYNAWCEREIVRVSNLHHGPLHVRLNQCEIGMGQKPFHYQENADAEGT